MNIINKILITGACGVTSRTIARSLRKSQRFNNTKLIGTDVCYNLFGLYEGLFDRIYRVPWEHNALEYKQIMIDICLKEKIDFAIIATELEVLFWTKNSFPVATLLPPSQFSRNVISKASLYNILKGTNLIPKFAIFDKNSIDLKSLELISDPPYWMREYSRGSTSGKGSIKINNIDDINAWLMLNPSIDNYMVSEFLPGKNIACLLLYNKGKLVKICCYERLEYFMAKTTISGISGNINKGKLINDPAAVKVSTEAIERICNHTNEIMTGLVTVDLCGDTDGAYKITEINIKQVAAASAFSEINGANISEAYVMTAVGRDDLIGDKEILFPKNNLVLRDIDGYPIVVIDYKEIKIGKYFELCP